MICRDFSRTLISLYERLAAITWSIDITIREIWFATICFCTIRSIKLYSDTREAILGGHRTTIQSQNLILNPQSISAKVRDYKNGLGFELFSACGGCDDDLITDSESFSWWVFRDLCPKFASNVLVTKPISAVHAFKPAKCPDWFMFCSTSGQGSWKSG